jgi:hypothetical protein
MGRKKRPFKPLETIWEVSDELWTRIEPILLEDAPPPPPAKGGRKRTCSVSTEMALRPRE